MKVLTILNTDGNGYWSEVARAVRITDLKLAYVSKDRQFGELRVVFNTNDWDLNKHGLIYTDRQFVKELREWLTKLGYCANKDTVFYSEQGMQGDNYVSLDVVGPFIASWDELHKVAEPA